MAKRLPPVHPGEVLLEEFLEHMGISQYRLAKDISVPPRRINEIVQGAIPGGDRARPWLFGVARNLLLKGVTHRRSNLALVERLASELRALGGANAPADLDRSDVWAALAALPELDREILTLSAWEELTPSQIATVLGSSPNVARVRLHRARARLRQALGPSPPVGRRADYAAAEHLD